MKTATVLTSAALALALAACGDAERVEPAAYRAAADAAARETSAPPPRGSGPGRTAPFAAAAGDPVTGVVRIRDLELSFPGGAPEESRSPEEGGAQGPAGFIVEVTLGGLPPGRYAWHLHDGPCGEQAGVVVAMTDLGDRQGISTPLEVDDEEQIARGAAMIRSLSLEQVETGRYSLRVHAPAESGVGPVVACADLGDRGETVP